MEFKQAKQLVDDYISGTCTEEERLLVEKFLDSHQSASLKANLSDKEKALRLSNIKSRLVDSIEQGDKGSVYRFLPKRLLRLSVAAAVLIAFSAGVYLYLSKGSEAITPELAILEDVAPGGNKATLTLADGREIILDDRENGQIYLQEGVEISKAKEGQIVYNNLDGSLANEVNLNTLATPRTGTYQLILPDGTNVWLNASSSITYPTSFTENKREVSITGEAYFEVAKQKGRPFLVSASGQTVEVLGTHFNINSYDNEGDIRTTLLEGSVRVWANDNPAMTKTLRPGEQSILVSEGSDIQVEKANTEVAVSWKNGYFQIDEANIESIMRQIERWYDVEVEYNGKIPERRISGKIRRNENVSKVLEMLNYFNLQFIIKDKKIIVSPT